MNDQWLGSLKTDSPQAGYELAIKLSRMGVKYTQPSDAIGEKLRPIYGESVDSLIASSQVIAIIFKRLRQLTGIGTLSIFINSLDQ